MGIVSDTFRGSLTLPDRRPVHEWAADNIDFGSAEGFKGRYNVQNVPWTREVLAALDNPHVREATFIAPPQESGKTICAEVWVSHRACTMPAKMAWNTTTNVKALAFSDTRWQQLVGYCRALSRRFSANRHDKKKNRIVFRDRAFLLIQGAETDANRQSDSIEVQVNDEVHLWEASWLSQMHSRLRAFRDTRKILNISVGGYEGSELEERFKAGTQREWSHHCPGCGRVFQYVFDHKSPKCNIRFDLDRAVMHANGSLDLAEFEKTIRVVCLGPGCGHEIRYDRTLLEKLNQDGTWVTMNQSPEPGVESFHVNAFAIGRRPWVEILKPWVRLNLRGGVFNPEMLRLFITEDLAEFWKQKPVFVAKDLRLGDYTREDMLKPGGWPDEWIRAMWVDNQKGGQGDTAHRWFVCRAYARDGRSRLVDCGRINEWEGVRRRQHELGVPDWTEERPGPWVLCDRAYNPGMEVDEVCARSKWFGLLGQDTEYFEHSQRSEYHGLRMYFSEERLADVGFGTAEAGRIFAVYYLWSSQRVQDLLAELRAGRAEEFGLPRDLMDFCPEYAEHINSHRQVMEQTKNGGERLVWKKFGPDHLYDCESMAVVTGLMAGVFQRNIETQKQEP
jgi:hypothetical protein